jgi:hypothetical protein
MLVTPWIGEGPQKGVLACVLASLGLWQAAAAFNVQSHNGTLACSLLRPLAPQLVCDLVP